MNHRPDPDEILLDASNLPELDTQQFEGRLEKPIAQTNFRLLCGFFLLVLLVFLGRLFHLQVLRGEAYATRAENNTLRHWPIFAERGTIFDRYGKELVWNEPAGRRYLTENGFAHLLGYVSFPLENEIRAGYYPKEMIGRDGIERSFNDVLHGESGVKIEEVDVRGNLRSDYLLQPPAKGQDVWLSIDARLQAKLYQIITQLIAEGRFTAGSGIVMDIATGELLAMTNSPEYDPNLLSAGADREEINQALNNPLHPFLNRAIVGLYAPGSAIKPIIALAALNEGIVRPEKKILSTGALTVANPFDPGRPSIFRDWKAHGWVDLKEAIAVSSNVYFYSIGGGAGDQMGLGAKRIKEYAELFGLGQTTGLNLIQEKSGLIPTPEWKATVFNNEPWRIGDTYNISVGQYGWQVTPLQLVRATAAIASDGRLIQPTALAARPETPPRQTFIPIPAEHFSVVKEGMRLAVTAGTARGLYLPYVNVAAKTGTAEIGVDKANTNSFIMGFWPSEAPRYVFGVVLEGGKAGNLIGGVFVMRQFFDWLAGNAPEYFPSKNPTSG